jgi:hypothetical protein
MNRREFLETVAAAAVLPTLGRQDSANEWGTPVVDLHFHLRPQPAANLAHLDGAGIAKANLLTRGRALDQVKALQAAAPGRFTWFSSYDVTQPDAEQVRQSREEWRARLRRNEISRRRRRSELRRIARSPPTCTCRF